jgi:hypothetical protein
LEEQQCEQQTVKLKDGRQFGIGTCSSANNRNKQAGSFNVGTVSNIVGVGAGAGAGAEADGVAVRNEPNVEAGTGMVCADRRDELFAAEEAPPPAVNSVGATCNACNSPTTTFATEHTSRIKPPKGGEPPTLLTSARRSTRSTCANDSCENPASVRSTFCEQHGGPVSVCNFIAKIDVGTTNGIRFKVGQELLYGYQNHRELYRVVVKDVMVSTREVRLKYVGNTKKSEKWNFNINVDNPRLLYQRGGDWELDTGGPASPAAAEDFEYNPKTTVEEEVTKLRNSYTTVSTSNMQFEQSLNHSSSSSSSSSPSSTENALSPNEKANLRLDLKRVLEVHQTTQGQLEHLHKDIRERREGGTPGPVLRLTISSRLRKMLKQDFNNMFEAGDFINGNTVQIVVPEPGKLHPPSLQNISNQARTTHLYSNYLSLNPEFQQCFTEFVATNMCVMRTMAAKWSGSLPKKMLLSMAALLLSNGTKGQGPHVDQYKSKKAVQLIVYLSEGPCTRVYSYPSEEEIKAAASGFGISMDHCRIASRAGALMLDRSSLDKHMMDPTKAQPGDVRMIPGDQVHSAPPSVGKRLILFLMHVVRFGQHYFVGGC